MKDVSDTKSIRMCSLIIHTSIDLDDYTIEDMNQKTNYYKALQIAASLTYPKVFLNKEEITKP